VLDNICQHVLAFSSTLFGSITHRGGRDARVPVPRRFAAKLCGITRVAFLRNSKTRLGLLFLPSDTFITECNNAKTLKRLKITDYVYLTDFNNKKTNLGINL
jgi:hypothetical protein